MDGYSLVGVLRVGGRPGWCRGDVEVRMTDRGKDGKTGQAGETGDDAGGPGGKGGEGGKGGAGEKGGEGGAGGKGGEGAPGAVAAIRRHALLAWGLGLLGVIIAATSLGFWKVNQYNSDRFDADKAITLSNCQNSKDDRALLAGLFIETFGTGAGSLEPLEKVQRCYVKRDCGLVLAGKPQDRTAECQALIDLGNSKLSR